MIDPRTPILVGCGQITDTTATPSSERSNVAFCAEAARLALGDASASIGPEALARKIDAVAVPCDRPRDQIHFEAIDSLRRCRFSFATP